MIFKIWKSKSKALISNGQINDTKVILVKPQDYMNSSGQPISSVAKFYKIPVEDIFVIHDEVELIPGRIKIKQGGGHAGHNGLKDIDKCCTNNYHRIRIGVGRSDTMNLYNWVLSDFSEKDHSEWLDSLIVDVTNDIGNIIK